MAILIGLSLPLAVGGTLSASPVPEALPGTSTSSAPAPSQPPAPAGGAAPGAPAAVPTTPPAPISLIGPETRSSFMKQFQSRLRAKGQKIKVTGRYDKPTTKAVTVRNAKAGKTVKVKVVMKGKPAKGTALRAIIAGPKGSRTTETIPV